MSDTEKKKPSARDTATGCGCCSFILLAPLLLLGFCGSEEQRMQAPSPSPMPSPQATVSVTPTPTPSSPSPRTDALKDPAKAKLVYNFCYAMQSSAMCDNLSMRVDTEGKVQQQIGGEFRGLNMLYNDDCLAGINATFDELAPESATTQEQIDEQKRQQCPIIEAKYGCNGSEIPTLLQSNVSDPNGTFCEYMP